MNLLNGRNKDVTKEKKKKVKIIKNKKKVPIGFERSSILRSEALSMYPYQKMMNKRENF